MAITASRTTLGMDREVNSEAASQRARRSLLNKGYRQARKEKDYGKALAFSDKMEEQGMPRGTTGSAENVGSLAMGRVASRESLATQMRGQLPALAGQTREGNVAAAKRSGTFDATRSAYNEKAGAFGKQMDEQGNIAATPPVAGAKPVAGTTPSAAGTPPPPSMGIVNEPVVPPKKEVTVIPAGTPETSGSLSDAEAAKVDAVFSGKPMSARAALKDALSSGRIKDTAISPEEEKARQLKSRAGVKSSGQMPEYTSRGQMVISNLKR